MRTFPQYLAPSAAPNTPTEEARLLHQLRMTLSQIHCTAGTAQEIERKLEKCDAKALSAAEKATGIDSKQILKLSGDTLKLYPDGPKPKPEPTATPKSKPDSES